MNGQVAEERRCAERIPLSMQITVHFTEGDSRWTETDATLVDLSSDGMFIRCDRMPRSGQHILVGLLHHKRGLCAAWGQTVRFDGWGGFAVQFKRINHPLSEFVSELANLAITERNQLVSSAMDARIWIDANDPF
ncbi:MAG: PilZ domain-containing protein [Proteobacteria bacterium]|nr:PilZ domain-containing protein [Pseudomonadota bacterium]